MTFRKFPGIGWYITSVVVLVIGILIAAQRFPGGFDWPYMVASALASQRYNPDGNVWYAGGFGLATALHWPYINALRENLGTSESTLNRFALLSLRLGLSCGILIGAEGVFVRDLGHWFPRGHEILALCTFIGLYTGLLIFLIQAMFQQKIYALPAALVTLPLVAIGISQLWIYYSQREIGWLNSAWREMGIPVWLSFAFWQWLAIFFLTIGLGSLSLIRKN